MTIEPHRDERALELIVSEIEQGTIRVFRNLLNRPYIRCEHPKFPEIECELNDEVFRGWIVHFTYTTTTTLLHEREVDRILMELAGRSLSLSIQVAHPPDLLRKVELEPVIGVVLEFMQSKTRFERTMESLWIDLHKFAAERKLLSAGKKRFPGGSNVLSRKLAQFTDIFKQLGITVEIKRSNGCQVTLTRGLDDSRVESSAESSNLNGGDAKELQPMDDRSARIQRLQQFRKP